MKVVLLAFLLAVGGILFFAFAPGTVSLASEIFSNIQNELVAEMPGVKKAWENADQRVEEMSSKVRAGLKKEFDRLMRNSPTAGKHEPGRDDHKKPDEPSGDNVSER